MADIKTKITDESVEGFLQAIADEGRRNECFKLLDIYKQATGESPKMWGTSIIGFGQYHYKSERSSQEGDWPLTAFSPRKQNLTLYVYPDKFPELLQKLGKYKTSVSCLYIRKLDDVDLDVLKALVRESYVWARKELL